MHASSSSASLAAPVCRICWDTTCEANGSDEFLRPTPCACRDERSNVHQYCLECVSPLPPAPRPRTRRFEIAPERNRVNIPSRGGGAPIAARRSEAPHIPKTPGNRVLNPPPRLTR